MEELDDVTLLICRAISLICFSLCCVMRLPQIYTVVKSQRVQGLNLNSLLMEFWCFNIMMAYPCANGYPVTAYSEMLLLVLQDLVLLIVVLHVRRQLNPMSWASLVGFMSFIGAVCMAKFPVWVLNLMATSVTPLGPSGKVLQLWSIVKARDAGTVSALGWGMATFAATLRIYTGYVQAQDMFMVFMSSQASVLNGLICLSILWYGTKPHET